MTKDHNIMSGARSWLRHLGPEEVLKSRPVGTLPPVGTDRTWRLRFTGRHIWAVGTDGSAGRLQRSGHRFESYTAHLFRMITCVCVAQLVALVPKGPNSPGSSWRAWSPRPPRPGNQSSSPGRPANSTITWVVLLSVALPDILGKLERCLLAYPLCRHS